MNQTIYIRKDVWEKFQTEEKKSELVNNLLDDWYSGKISNPLPHNKKPALMIHPGAAEQIKEIGKIQFNKPNFDLPMERKARTTSESIKKLNDEIIEPQRQEAERHNAEVFGRIFKTPAQAKVAVSKINKAKDDGLCPDHGVPLDARGRCMQKKCKYS